ncbi:MAG: FG-GAP-like repeat-containing protein [Candidatus Krumholzibacteriia bacterium]
MSPALRLGLPLLLLAIPLPAQASSPAAIEVSSDGWETAIESQWIGTSATSARDDEVLYPPTPDWESALRMQVGGLQVADMNGDGLLDVVVGCYQSNSFPPYEDWFNMIYYNVGGALEADPSWISTDQVSTGDIQVAFIDGDAYPDVFAANGGFSMAPSVIYWGGPGGPATTPTWHSNEPGGAWNNYALPFDIDHDGDVDIITANQGNSTDDPSRPLYAFINQNGVLPAQPSWASAEWCLSNFLDMADWDGDGWEDLAVSKWANYQSGIYRNLAGALATVPAWTTGDTDTDKGVAWADVDGNGWPDLALGHDPTTLFANDGGALTASWTSTASYFGHSDLRFDDVDRDGDPDLAEIHFSNGQAHIYLNRGGVLDSAPSWTYDASSVGTALAFGDINGDQWPDLVLGFSGDACVKVFYAQPTTAVEDAPPAAARLLAAAPNPFNPSTTITVELDRDLDALALTIYDTAGRRVRALAAGPMAAGRHELRWDGRDDAGRAMDSGVYLARLDADGRRQARKLTLLK